jgi:hypothetical protein
VTAWRETGVPQRTFSDALFSIPIQDSILDGVFPEEPALDTSAAGDNPYSCNPEPFVDSGKEDEHQELLNSCYEARSLEHTSWSPAAQTSSISQSSLGVGSYSSLPPEVLEFRKMFENGDESYPADFPESLRS